LAEGELVRRVVAGKWRESEVEEALTQAQVESDKQYDRLEKHEFCIDAIHKALDESEDDEIIKHVREALTKLDSAIA